MEKEYKNLNCLLITGLIICGLLVYSNTFDVPFHLDDETNIVIHGQIKNLSKLREVIRGTDRPVAMIVNALNYHFGGLNVQGYHYVNITIHILTAIVLYFILLNTLALPSLSAKYGDKKYSLSFIASLIFAIHPIQTQAITYIIQGRMAGLATLFYLSALLFFILGTKAQRVVSGQWSVVSFLPIPHSSLPHSLTTMSHSNSTATSSLHHFITSSLFYLLAICSSALGMGTKQIAATAPVMILIYDYFFISNGSLRELKKRTPVHLGLFLTISVVIYFSVTGIQFGDSGVFWVKEFTPFQYLFNQFKVVLYYVFLLLFPINLNVDYDWPISRSFFEPLTIICFVLVVLLLLLALKIHKKNRLLSFCILWYFITLTPESSIVPIKDVIFEHRIYLPSTFSLLFFILLLSDGLKLIKDRYGIKTEDFCCFVVLFGGLILGTLTYQRNKIWRGDITLWEDCVKKSPNKLRPNALLASAYLISGEIEKACLLLKKTIKMDPPNAGSVYTNLGYCYLETGKPYLAIKVLKKAVRLEPTIRETYLNLGVAYTDIGQYKTAVKFYKEAIKLASYYPEVYKNLGQTYEHMGKYELALKTYKQLIEQDPKHGEGYVKLGLLYNNKFKNTPKAIYYLTKALDYLPHQDLKKVNEIIGKIKSGNEKLQTLNSKN